MTWQFILIIVVCLLILLTLFITGRNSNHGTDNEAIRGIWYFDKDGNLLDPDERYKKKPGNANN